MIMRDIKNKKILMVFIVSILIGALIPTLKNNKLVEPQSTIDNKDEILSNTVKKCQEEEDCFNREFREIAKKYDYEIAFEVLKKLIYKNPKFSYCHFMAHSIGHGAYEKNPDRWNTTLNNISDECSYGAAHGILEQYASTLREQNESLLSGNIMREICKDQRSSCGHILGHVVLIETEADVPEAIKACDALDEEYNRWCINGIFMEHVYPQTLVQHGLAESSRLRTSGRLSEFSALCNSFQNIKVASICWGEISRGAIAEFGSNWNKMLEFCDTAPLSQSRKICKDRVVETLVVSRNFDIIPLKDLCRADNAEFEKTCYIKLIGGKMDNDVILENDKAANFCLSLEPTFQESCFRQIGQSLANRDIKNETINVVCKSVPSEYQNNCRRGWES